MEALRRNPTETTPFVNLDPASRTFVMAGRSIPIDAELFYKPILNWLDALAAEKKIRNIQFCFRFDFFNIASSKRILFILYKLSDLQRKGCPVLVRWMYEKCDEDMLEIGQDYSFMIENLPFTFEEYDAEELTKERMLKLG